MRRTIVALWLAVLATVMASPIFVLSLSWSGTPRDPKAPSGWPVALWMVAFLVGLASMDLALGSRRTERLLGSKRGRKLATWAYWVAIFGAGLWTYTFLLAANASM